MCFHILSTELVDNIKTSFSYHKIKSTILIDIIKNKEFKYPSIMLANTLLYRLLLFLPCLFIGLRFLHKITLIQRLSKSAIFQLPKGCV